MSAKRRRATSGGRGGRRQPRLFESRDASDPQGLVALVKQYLEWMAIQNYSEGTCYTRERQLDGFISWCELRGLTRANEITRPILQRYQRWLYLYRKPANGLALSFQVQRERLVALRVLFKWLVRQNHLLFNPASELELPRQEVRLPRAVLTADEAERIVTLPDTGEPQGVRDRAILESVYSTGMRRMEVVHLKRYDLDTERGTLFIRQGKGKKDRVVPIGDRAVHWLERYLHEARPELVVEPDEDWLFVTSYGQGFTRMGMSNLVRRYVKDSGVDKGGACHLFRHTMATLMLENGADIRYIQQMLGHAKLTTTEIYTQVSIRKLQEVHRLTHPTARLATPEAPSSPASTPADADPPPTREALLETLAAEATEDGDDLEA